jgi:hypothetical protein
MKTITLKSDTNLDVLGNIIPGICFNVGDWFQSDPLERGKSHVSAGSGNLFLKIHPGGEFPVYLELPEGENNLTLIRSSKNLAYLECNSRPIAYFAVQDGVFNIPAEFSGVLFYQLSYETIFPDFAALPNLSGLCLSGYTGNINDWEKLGKAIRIKLFSASAYEPYWATQLNCHLKTLHCTDAFFKQLDASLLQDIETLFLEGGNNDTFEKIFRLPFLQRIFLNTSSQLPEEKDRLLLCASLARIIDPAFPDMLPKLGNEKINDYSVYMSSITEYINRYGTENTGMEVKKIFEMTTDYPMESGEYLEIRPYGISEYGSLFLRQNKTGGAVQFKIEATREKALSMLHEITGLNTALKQDPYNETIKLQVQSSISQETEFKDPNRKEFEIKTQLFADKANKIIIPLYNYIAKELQGQGIDVEFRLDIDSPEDPGYYSANAWFSIYSSGRSQYSTFQYSQSASRLEPVILSIWNPEKWNNEHYEFKLEEITNENVTKEFYAFLRSLAKYFKYKWDS